MPYIQVSDIALKALEDALTVASDFTPEQTKMILELAKICIKNSVVHYRGGWFRINVGIPTGGPERGSIANIVVFYVLGKILLVDSSISHLNKISNRKRFLDDIWFLWTGTQRQFSLFKSALNMLGGKDEIGITFKGEVSQSVDFLDVSVKLEKDGKFTTKLFVKPTDASRYLHRRSDHGAHTFRSIPYSQYRRAVVLSSNESDQTKSMNYMTQKFLESGYSQEELNTAREKALLINRDEILNKKILNVPRENNESRQLTFTINRNDHMSKKIKAILRENQDDINTLLGEPTRLIVAERRNQNTASILFAKSGFSKVDLPMNESQKCGGGGGCLTCELMGFDKNIVLWKDNPARRKEVKLDFRYNCQSDNLIYIFVCKLCPKNDNFYVGQTTNSCRGRNNGHRGKFNVDGYKKSALSFHIFEDHPDHVAFELRNFSLGIIVSTSPQNLDRLEDFYVEWTDAELSLNRHKVTER